MDRREAIKKASLVTGASVILPSFMSLLQSCQAEPRLDWQPQFFQAEEARFISTLVDILLPKTDTPGALDVKVDMFLDKVFAQTYDAQSQQAARQEINRLMNQCKDKYQTSLSKMEASDQISFLRDLEAEGGKFRPGVWGTAVGEERQPVSFYRRLKSMALWAYLTSEEIGKHVLNYDPIPQEYLGCIPLSEVGNSWSF